MTRILLVVLTAAVLFGLSATASWKWRQKKMAEAATGSNAESSTANGHEESAAGTKNSPGGGRSTEPAAEPKLAESVPANTASSNSARLRAAARPAYAGGIDDALQLAASLRERMSVVKERETQMAARQTQLQLIYDDIRGEREAIDQLRKQIEEELNAAEAQLAAAEQRQADIEQREQQLKGRVTEMEGDEKDNIKKMAGMYDSMPPEGAAKILQEMCDSGSMDTAVKLLAVMKERQAAKVLAEMADPALAAQLSEKLKSLKRSTASTKK